MATDKVSNPLRGKTIRLTWTDGPTKGKTHEHVFHEDGTVEWRTVAPVKKASSRSRDAAKGNGVAERPRYAAFSLGGEACMFSYLSTSGYTLTVALRFADGSAVGFASNEDSWVPIRGTFKAAPGDESLAKARRTEDRRNSPRVKSWPRATS